MGPRFSRVPIVLSVTLVLGLIRQEGVYACVDHRLTHTRARRVADDAATKHVIVHYPPMRVGPRAVITYTGNAFAPDGTRTDIWIRNILGGGVQEAIGTSMNRIHEGLINDFGPAGKGLIVNVLAIDGDHRYFGGFSNIKAARPDGSASIESTFGYSMKEETEPYWFANGSGAFTLQAENDLVDRMQGLVETAPADPREHMDVLALVNRRVAEHEPTVSPHSSAVFQPPPHSELGPIGWTYTEGEESVPLHLPLILCGIDTTDMSAEVAGRAAEQAALDQDPKDGGGRAD